jgi:VWFA-related protein
MPRKSPFRTSPLRHAGVCAAASIVFFVAVSALHSQQPAQQDPKSQQPAPAPAAPASPAPSTPAPQPSGGSNSASGSASGAPPSAGSLSTEVKLVTLYASVRDKKGKIISNLDKNNFTVEEDGRPQAIKYFSRDPDVALLFGLLVDTSLSQRHVIGAERTASATFIDQMLRRDKDKAFLIHFDHDVELLEDLTNSREKLRAALNDLRVVSRDEEGDYGGGRGGGGGGDGRGGRGGYHRAGTLLYDSIYLAANEIMKKQQGRKAVVVLTDGEDRGSKVTLSDAVEAAQRADMLVYSVLFVDPDSPRSGGYSSSGGGPYGGRRGGPGRYPQQEQRPDGKKILDRIAKETGGRLFQVTKKESVEEIYAELEDELRKQYSLGYTPDRPDPGKGYHMLKVSTNQKDLSVQSRDGYYSDK